MGADRYAKVSLAAFLQAIDPAGRTKPYVRLGVLTSLRRVEPHEVAMPQLIEAVYGGREDGAPLDPANAIACVIWWLRRGGIPIVRRGNSYALERAEA
jgi:hypothetical protein